MKIHVVCFRVRSLVGFFLIAFALIFSSVVWAGGSSSSAAQLPTKPGAAAMKVKSIADVDLKLIETLDRKYQDAKSVSMKVEKKTKIGLLAREKNSKGKLLISAGRLRMELEGDEKTLLVINKKNLWAVTYPPEEFKDAAIQVIKGDSTTKKARSQSIVNLLTQGGLLKFFKATGVMDGEGEERVFFLQPQKEQTDFTRAQLRVSKDGQRILGLRYWDDRDNETNFSFSDVSFGKKLEEKAFQFSPPANADVMTL